MVEVRRDYQLEMGQLFALVSRLCGWHPDMEEKLKAFRERLNGGATAEDVRDLLTGFIPVLGKIFSASKIPEGVAVRAALQIIQSLYQAGGIPVLQSTEVGSKVKVARLDPDLASEVPSQFQAGRKIGASGKLVRVSTFHPELFEVEHADGTLAAYWVHELKNVLS